MKIDIKLHETCKCKCRSDASVCNNKQRWDKDKCSCKCKGLIGKGICDKEFIWNPSNCDSECDKSCSVSEYLDYEKCGKKGNIKHGKHQTNEYKKSNLLLF